MAMPIPLATRNCTSSFFLSSWRFSRNVHIRLATHEKMMATTVATTLALMWLSENCGVCMSSHTRLALMPKAAAPTRPNLVSSLTKRSHSA